MGEVKVGDCLEQSDHGIVEFSIIGDVKRVTSKTTFLNFQRADFNLFRALVARGPGSLNTHQDGNLKGARTGCL